MGKELESTKSLEKQLASTRKELERYKNETDKLGMKFAALSSDFQEMSDKYNNSQRLRVIAEKEVSGLRKEIGELSGALFSQANEMVSTARRSEDDFKQKNRHLENEIKEKDEMIETYKSQLEQLKSILSEIDTRPQQLPEPQNEGSDGSETAVSEDSRSGSAPVSSTIFDENKIIGLEDLVYSPPVQCLRYDLELYQYFATFARQCVAQQDKNDESGTASGDELAGDVDIKETKFYKKILHDDIHPTLRLDSAPGVSFLQKRSLMSAIVSGRVIIEPISSVNESFKRNSNISTPQRPIATPDACSICGEVRNDSLEHARLYMLKIISSKLQKGKKTDTESESGTSSHNGSSASIASDSTASESMNEFTYMFPMCAYCVFRVRSVCELYAFLRSLKQGVWKFDKEVNVKKAWIECIRIRLKMFWSRQGLWDSDKRIIDNKIFKPEQIAMDVVEQDTSFEFRKQTENKRHSYAGSLSSRLSSLAMGSPKEKIDKVDPEEKVEKKESDKIQKIDEAGEILSPREEQRKVELEAKLEKALDEVQSTEQAHNSE